MTKRNTPYIEFREFYAQDSALDPIPARSIKLYIHDEFVDLWRQVTEVFAQYQRQPGTDRPDCYSIRFAIPRSWYRVVGAGGLNLYASLEFTPTGFALILVAPDNDRYAVTETESISYKQLPIPQ